MVRGGGQLDARRPRGRPSAVERQAPDGVVSHRDAQHEFREHLGKVDRGWSRPKPLVCPTYADAWSDEGERRRHWKPTTTVAYKTVLERLAEFFGPMKLVSDPAAARREVQRRAVSRPAA